MRFHVVARAVGALIACLALVGLLPLLADWVAGFPIWPWLVMLALLCGCGGGLWYWGSRRDEQMGLREGVAITSLIWIIASFLAGTGIWLATPASTWMEGWFEAMSGFTTTGSSIFGEQVAIADLSPGVHLWRALLQWMGGIGIVVISLALLPLLVAGSGFQLYRAEVPGIDTDRLAPRIRDSARILLRLYLGMTIFVFLGLMACGANAFDAICHAMTTVSTGGFSTYDNSVEGLGSAAAEWILIIGMLLAGFNFGLLLQAVRGKPLRIWRSSEARLYLLLCGVASALVACSLALAEPAYAGRPHDLLRDSFFQVVSLTTTTGFGTGYDILPAAWEAWPAPATVTLLFLMIGGACAGSTAGGIKLVRFLVAWTAARRELRRYVEPTRITPIHLDGHAVKDQVVLQVATFFFIYLLSWLLGTIGLALSGQDLVTAGSAALSCLSNIGPGLGEVGPADHFAGLGASGELICIMLMLLGRLEFFGVLMLLRPRTWQR